MTDMDPVGGGHAAISDDYTEGIVGSIAAEAVRRAVMVAWMAVLLGILVQLLMIALNLGLGTGWPGVAVLGDVAQGVSWAVLVCIGLAVGTVAGRDRALVMGLLGLVSGPVAWGLAKGAQRTVQSAMDLTPAGIDLFFYLVCAIKGVEYAALGAVLGYLSQHEVTRIRSYFLLGVAVGVLAAGAMTGLSLWRAAQLGTAVAPARLIGTAVNEFVFPIGCALVICMALRMKRLVGLR
ncbi:hypothetical protein [Ancylobacter defluvii]|uniref:Uncharacterized protein n=1 Tax=Ancylobacter defluvii TaxID=1282440 RepID=A0A9W6K1G0_9HYPH|nr:hypothetical protein [Ancylobacter defluvii]MBS7586462.1 hypothetical protein [Ancylobacter defluvii]GLK85744.1 hypothetical protein GCM10017653_38140 [Ancylobacter defluvii]